MAGFQAIAKDRRITPPIHSWSGTGARAASVTMANNVVVASGVDVLVATATSEGLWGNGIRIEVDYGTVNPLDRFNLTVAEYRDQGGVVTVATREVHRNLSMDSNSAFYAVDVVNAGSTLVRLTRPGGRARCRCQQRDECHHGPALQHEQRRLRRVVAAFACSSTAATPSNSSSALPVGPPAPTAPSLRQ
jgi:hypothetical protein